MKQQLAPVLLTIAFAMGCAHHVTTEPKSFAGPATDQVALIEPGFHDCTLPVAAELDDLSAAQGCYDIPMRENARVRRWLHYYQGRGRTTLERRLANSGLYLYDVRTELAVSGLPEDLSYIPMALTGFETDGRGPWNLDRHTASQYGGRNTWWTDPRLDVEKSTRIAATRLRSLHRKYDDWYLAMAAFTAGTDAVDNAIRRSGKSDYWQLAGYLPRKHRDDVPRVLAVALIAKHPATFDFDDVSYRPRRRTDLVTLRTAASLYDLARLADTDEKTLAALNPALVRGCTPPALPWDVRIPRGSAEAVASGVWELSRSYTCGRHVVKPGETVSGIARKYEMGTEELLRMNAIANPRTLKSGSILSVRKKAEVKDDEDRPFNTENLPQPLVEPGDEKTPPRT